MSLDQFGFDQFGRGNDSPNLAHIRCPLLVVLGTKEEHIAKRDDLEIVRRSAVAAAQVDMQVIEGADHFYALYEQEVASSMAHWAYSFQ